MNSYYAITSRNEATRSAGKLTSWFGHFGPEHRTMESAIGALSVQPWFDDADPTTVVRVDEVKTGPRSIRFKITALT